MRSALMPSLEWRCLAKGENIQIFILIGGHLLTQKGYLPSIVVVHIGLEHPFLGCLGNKLLDTGLYFIVLLAGCQLFHFIVQR